MPEEVFVLIVLSVLSFFGLTMTSMILRHRRKQRGSAGASSESSMTTSQLESTMRRAVEDATAPLSAKIEDLEIEVVKLGSASKQLEAHDASTRISLEDQDEVLDVEPVSARAKTGS